MNAQLKIDVLRLLLDETDSNKLELVKKLLQDDTIELSKEKQLTQLESNLREAFDQIKLHQEGEIKLKSAKEFLDEL